MLKQSTCWRLLLWSVLVLVIGSSALFSLQATAQARVLWQHDDSVLSLSLDAGEGESDSFKLMSAFTAIPSDSPTFKRIETSDQKLKIYCAGAPNRQGEVSSPEASCNIEFNFFKSVSNEGKTASQILLVQNPSDVALLSTLFRGSSDNAVHQFKSNNSDLCIQCKQNSSQPVCAVSLASEHGSCQFLTELKATSTDNVFVNL